MASESFIGLSPRSRQVSETQSGDRITLMLRGGFNDQGTTYKVSFNGAGQWTRNIDSDDWQSVGDQSRHSILNDPSGSGNNNWVRGPAPIELEVLWGGPMEVYDAVTEQLLFELQNRSPQSVGDVPEPELSVDSCSVPQGPVEPGAETSVEIAVSNPNAVAMEGTVRVRVDGQPVGSEPVALELAGSDTVTVSFSAPADAGDHAVEAITANVVPQL